MLPNSTLLTPNEIITSAPVATNSAASEFASLIVSVEEDLFNKCFGWDFYLALLEDKRDMSAATAYRETITYSIGALVCWNGKYYTCTSSNIGQLPSNENYWSLAAKFENEDYEFFWVRYLKSILSFIATRSTVVYRAIKDDNQGLIKRKGEDFDPASLKEIMAVKAEAKSDIDRMIENADMYLRRNPDKFPLYGPNQETSTCCETKKCKPRRNFGINVSRS